MIVKFKNKIIFFFIIFLIPLKGFAENKIVFMDINYVLSNTNVGKNVLQNLSINENKKKKEFEDKEIKLKDEENKILATKNIVSEEQLNFNIKEFQKTLKNYRNFKSEEFDKLKKKRKEEILKVLDKINPIIEEYIKNNSITIVLDKKNIYIADTNYDISKNLVELINNKIK